MRAIAGIPTIEWRARFFAADFCASSPSVTPTDLCGVISPLRHELNDGRPTPCYVLRTYGSNYGQNADALRELMNGSKTEAAIMRRRIAIYLAKRLSGAIYSTMALTFECHGQMIRQAVSTVALLRTADRKIRERLEEHERAIASIVAAEVSARASVSMKVSQVRAFANLETQKGEV